MPRRYNEVEPVLLADVRPDYIVISRRIVTQVTATPERVTLTFADGSTVAGPPDAGLEVLASSVRRRRDDTSEDEAAEAVVPIEDLEGPDTPGPELEDPEA